MAYQVQLHTHTWRCKHAVGDAIDYARIAAAGGCRVLGISDHMPHPDGRWSDVRMALADLGDYEAAVAAAQEAEPNLTVLLGMECEWLPELTAFYQDELLGRRGYRYLIGAGHYIEIDGRWRGTFENVRTVSALRRYVELLTGMMEARIFAFIAHPDCIGAGLDRFDADVAACVRDLAAAAVATGTPLELNAYGLRKQWRPSVTGGMRPGYPWEPFWAVAAEAGVSVVLNSDAHRPQDVLHGHDELCQIRDRYGLREANPAALIGSCAAGLFSQDPPPSGSHRLEA